MPAELKIVPSFVARVFRGRDFSILSPPGYNRMSRLKWLYAPTPEAIAFALRTTFAALMALTIAMWMELDALGGVIEDIARELRDGVGLGTVIRMPSEDEVSALTKESPTLSA